MFSSRACVRRSAASRNRPRPPAADRRRKSSLSRHCAPARPRCRKCRQPCRGGAKAFEITCASGKIVFCRRIGSVSRAPQSIRSGSCAFAAKYTSRMSVGAVWSSPALTESAKFFISASLSPPRRTIRRIFAAFSPLKSVSYSAELLISSCATVSGKSACSGFTVTSAAP